VLAAISQTQLIKIDVEAEESCLVMKGGGSLLDRLSNATADCLHIQNGERLEGNTVYRDCCSSGKQCTSIHRGLDRTTGNEQYVVVPDGNIMSLAT
jgi:hypothetical protein